MQRVKAFEEFLCPFGCMISGPSMSGKSFFILELLRRNKEYFLPPPDRIVYAYGSWQEAFSMVPNVEFVDGVESLKAITFDSKKNNLLVLDDLMEELSSDKNASTLFTRDMHHKNVTVFFIVQNLFKQGKSMRDIALNCQVLILFSSPRDHQQIKVLERQTGIKGLSQAYDEAIKEPYGHLVVNLQPKTPSAIRLQTDILSRHRKIKQK